jgi:two-component sensor histidine kinase
MRIANAVASLETRIRRPGTWGAMVLAAFLWSLLRLANVPGGWEWEDLPEAVLLGAGLVLLAPLPWQWSGDDRPLAAFPRGLAQALTVNLVLTWSVFALTVWNAAPGMGYGPGSGMAPGMGHAMGHHGMMMGRGMPGPLLLGPFALNPMELRLLVLGCLVILAGMVLGRLLAMQEAERFRADEAERSGREAQARALQAQMNPHVLFNVVSGLAEMAHGESPRTEQALVSLAQVMRRLLEHAGRTAAPLAEERALVERLLELEQIRLGERLRVRWDWDAALELLAAPPLLLQPLVENAIKHGIAPERAGGELEVGLSGTSAELRLWVANTGRPYREGAPEGTGLSNLRKRLVLMGAGAARLELRAEAGRTMAELRFRPVEADHG